MSVRGMRPIERAPRLIVDEPKDALVRDMMWFYRQSGAAKELIDRYLIEPLGLFQQTKVRFVLAVAPNQKRRPPFTVEATVAELVRRRETSNARRPAKRRRRLLRALQVVSVVFGLFILIPSMVESDALGITTGLAGLVCAWGLGAWLPEMKT